MIKFNTAQLTGKRLERVIAESRGMTIGAYGLVIDPATGKEFRPTETHAELITEALAAHGETVEVDEDVDTDE
jgi:hypothetical protein